MGTLIFMSIVIGGVLGIYVIIKGVPYVVRTINEACHYLLKKKVVIPTQSDVVIFDEYPSNAFEEKASSGSPNKEKSSLVSSDKQLKLDQKKEADLDQREAELNRMQSDINNQKIKMAIEKINTVRKTKKILESFGVSFEKIKDSLEKEFPGVVIFEKEPGDCELGLNQVDITKRLINTATLSENIQYLNENGLPEALLLARYPDEKSVSRKVFSLAIDSGEVKMDLITMPSLKNPHQEKTFLTAPGYSGFFHHSNGSSPFILIHSEEDYEVVAQGGPF